MRIAVISDTHGNLRALDAVLDDIASGSAFDEVIFAGDIAFGGPFPAECIQRIRDRGWRAVRGNTDEIVIAAAIDGWQSDEQAADSSLRPTAVQQAVGRWDAERLSPDQVAYLLSLPRQVTVPHAQAGALTVVHATPWSVYATIPPDAPDSLARRVLDEAGTTAVAYGHIHVQYARRIEGRLLTAVGSVGMPFDGDQRAAYAVLTADEGGWSVAFRRVAYDVDAAIADTLRSGVPNADGYADTLRRAAPAG